ncbi:hypothetical protein [Streptomyces sp. ALI-76-A]|uniref:hypothetical protein n=1 Tax=Streptomyces sp. ALI-76-A TaxID=3025736 RepID=UPI00256F329B|nr:hypothetical protein [Streptomyces sp. ALI-76-A]MDL5205084.1 hypothetical protein [Streptomyces sp. ALI-76-A]
MPELDDTQLDQLIQNIGLTDPHRGQAIAPCGTQSAYTRHVKNGEPIDDACRHANAEAKRTKGTPTPSRRQPIEHGTLKGYKQHRYRDEQACDKCLEAHRLYGRNRDRKRAAARWAKRDGGQ